MTRKATDKLLQLVEDGFLDKDVVIQACLEYMSEDDVKDMMLANDFGGAEDDFIEDYQEFDEDRDFDDHEDDNY
jgi:hypothetical protein